MKLRDSSADAFKVVVEERANCDDLKDAIMKSTRGEVQSVQYIFTEEGGEVRKCRPDSSLSLHSPVGNSAINPFYYTIASPRMCLQESHSASTGNDLHRKLMISIDR